MSDTTRHPHAPRTAPRPLFTGELADRLGNDFRPEKLGQQIVHVDLGAATTRSLLTWEALNEILATRQLISPQLRLYREGAQVPPEEYARVMGEGAARREILQADRLYEMLRDGASLILDAIETLHPSVATAAEDLMRFVQEPVQANLYLTWGASQGFNSHWDDHDTFIVQIVGSKHWTVHGPGRPFPMRRDTTHAHICPNAVVWEGSLSPGHVLHVPRGWWHTVRGVGEMSLHLTFGFTRATGVDWACWVADQLREYQIFRQDLPRFALGEVLQARQRELRERLEEVLSIHGIEEYLAFRDQRMPRRHAFCLPDAVDFTVPDPDSVISFTPILPPQITLRDGPVTLRTDGTTFTFAGAMEPLLRLLAAHRHLTCRELRELSGLEPETFAVALEILCEQHLVTLAPVSIRPPDWGLSARSHDRTPPQGVRT